MARGRAHIDSPEVIQGFRNRFAAFAEACRGALIGADGEVKATVHWLRADQMTYWRVELRKREEALHLARSQYEEARWASSHHGRASCVDEKRALELAKRRKEEAERKLEAVKKWALLLEQKIDKMWGPCRSLSVLLDQLTPTGLARLDQMLDSLDDYFRSLSTDVP